MIISSSLIATATQNSVAQSYVGGSIQGRVTAQGIKYPCTVSVHERASHQVIEAKQTDMLGNYRFENLAFGFTFFVMATDPAKQFNAVIQDMVMPK